MVLTNSVKSKGPGKDLNGSVLKRQDPLDIKFLPKSNKVTTVGPSFGVLP